MIQKQTTSPTARAGRSPAYPGISLPEAIEKAKVLWRSQRDHPTQLDAVRGYLGYKSDNGASRRVIAALVHFGLLTEEGKGEGDARKFKCTEETRKLSLLPEGHPDALPIIRELALRPKIYAEMARKWPHSLPPDQPLQIFLTVEKRYNPEAVPELIKDFRKTYNFAQLDTRDGEIDTYFGGDGTLTESPYDEVPADRSQPTMSYATGHNPPPPSHTTPGQNMPAPNHADTTSYTLPLRGARKAYLYIPLGMTKKDFVMLGRAIELISDSVLDEDYEGPPEVGGKSAGEQLAPRQPQTLLPDERD